MNCRTANRENPRAAGFSPRDLAHFVKAFGLRPKPSAGGSRLALVVTLAMALFASTVSFAAEEPKPDFPKFEEVTKGMTTLEGYITLYRDAKKDKLFARIPANSLGKPFLLATSIARGPQYAGWQWSDGAVYWERIAKKLVLMEADPRHLKSKGTPVGDVIFRTYTDTIIKAVDILTEIDGDPVIDLSNVLKIDLVGVQPLFNGRFDTALARFAAIKNFEKNTEIDVDAPIMGLRGGPTIRIHYSFFALPESSSYQTRDADDRVGYFLTAVKDWSTDHSEKTIFKRHIHRWQLRKAESDKEISDVLPEDQIVFYMEKTIPVEFRRYVREGILEWNKAFEAIGLRNAIAVRQQTETIHAEKDPEDARYNFFRWIVSGIPYAMGPSRVNPFTGQILDADIVFDDALVRALIIDYSVFSPKAIGSASDPQLDEYLHHHPDWDTPVKRVETGVDKVTKLLDSFENHRASTWGSPSHANRCEYGLGAARRLAFGALAAAEAGTSKLPEEYIGQVIKEITSHEVGHTLGLRHNFKASSWLELNDIHQRATDDHRPTSASVMDYNSNTWAESKLREGRFVTSGIGPYDFWAVEYGYKPFATVSAKPTKPPTEGQPEKMTAGTNSDPGGESKTSAPGEKEMLRAIASRSAESGHAYGTDEDTSLIGPDPTIMRFDDGRDPLDFAKNRVQLVQRLWKDGLEWAVDEGKSRNLARRAMNILINEFGWGAMVGARLVGGQYVSRFHKGDADAGTPLQLVNADKQREALRFLGENALSDSAFKFPPELLNSLAAGRWLHWDSEAIDFELDYDIHGRVLAIQSNVLFLLMNPFTVNRVYDSAAMAGDGENPFTLPELFRTISGTVWSELETPLGQGNYTDRQPLVSSYRRSLQREHLRRLIQMVLAPPGTRLYPDAHSVARMNLKDLNERIAKRIKESGSRLDEFTQAHLADSNRRISKALEAEFTVNRTTSGASTRGVTVSQE